MSSLRINDSLSRMRGANRKNTSTEDEINSEEGLDFEGGANQFSNLRVLGKELLKKSRNGPIDPNELELMKQFLKRNRNPRGGRNHSRRMMSNSVRNRMAMAP